MSYTLKLLALGYTFPLSDEQAKAMLARAQQAGTLKLAYQTKSGTKSWFVGNTPEQRHPIFVNENP